LKKIISVVGARPNFMKMAPVHRAFQKYKSEYQHLICHTGQHYDEKMSKIFFEDLELPHPDFYLGVGSGSHAQQTARVMIEFEKILIEQQPECVIVYGDVNSTIACAMTAVKLGIKVAHVEAGLRSFDRTMPEEINRILTDSISDFLFVTEQSGIDNLKNEGVVTDKVFFVGNTMIDSLIYYQIKANQSNAHTTYELNSGDLVLATLHRPHNVDTTEQLEKIVSLLNSISEKAKILFPIHPRTRKNLEAAKLISTFKKNIIITEPIGYINFLSLMQKSKLIITDSGGIQEETTYLGIQCITARDNTERPSTVEIGTNQLVGTNWEDVGNAALSVLSGNFKQGSIPPLWDGHAAERIVEMLDERL